ncbi:MAG: thiamine phosphate synthase, partial [Campylobacteraceae bacterium]|nr:thiamine phosphate synthase [Campylobacteraceae bacterium]
MQDKLSGLYVLTDDTFTPHETLIEQVEALLRAGVKLIQLRDKIFTDDELISKALDLQSLCKDFGATFFINDRIDLAKKVNSDGLHIGIEDGNL